MRKETSASQGQGVKLNSLDTFNPERREVKREGRRREESQGQRLLEVLRKQACSRLDNLLAI